MASATTGAAPPRPRSVATGLLMASTLPPRLALLGVGRLLERAAQGGLENAARAVAEQAWEARSFERELGGLRATRERATDAHAVARP